MAGKRRILHKLTLTEVSAVDRPCVEHARAVIMKRDMPEDERIEAARLTIQKLRIGMANLQMAVALRKTYNPSQARDKSGMWTGGGGGKAVESRAHHDAAKDNTSTEAAPSKLRAALSRARKVAGGAIKVVRIVEEVLGAAVVAGAIVAIAQSQRNTNLANLKGTHYYRQGRDWSRRTMSKAASFTTDEEAQQFLDELPKYLNKEQMAELLAALEEDDISKFRYNPYYNRRSNIPFGRKRKKGLRLL